MLSRLLKLDARFARAVLGLSALHLLGLVVACGGKPFTADAGSAGASAGESSGGDSGSSEPGGAGGAPSGGSGGEVPNAGSGGKPSPGCDCAAGTYCQDGTSKCNSCADFSRLKFAAPQKLSTLSQAASVERFPRASGGSSGLFYTVGAPDMQRIWFASSPMSGDGKAASDEGQVDSGPIFAPGFMEKDLYFDRLEPMLGKRRNMMASWKGNAIVAAAAAGAPVNAPGASDYSIAIAPNVGHAYWMSTRNDPAKPELIWYSINESAPPPPAPLELTVNAAGCPFQGDDATPWVNLDGTLLLFRSRSVDETCALTDSGGYDLYAAPLNSAGSVAANGVALSALNQTGGGSSETDPSLSPDSCFVYFASDGGSADYDLYRAARN